MDYKPEIIDYFSRLQKVIGQVAVEEINTVLNILTEAYNQDKQVFIMGNGGSAATASHFVCDFNKGISLGKQKRFKLICLNDNIPTMLAYANDLSYADIFVEQLKNFFNSGDIVMGISGSGNSPNVLKALEYANQNAGLTIGLSGYDGGKLKKISKYNIHVPVQDMQITEDLHMVLDHLMMQILWKKLV